MSTWTSARRRIAAAAVAIAVLTGATAAVVGAPEWAGRAAGGYVLVVAAALFIPAAITVQVIGGQVLAGMLLLDPAGPAPLPALLVVASVVVTAELLGTVARLDTPLHPGPREDFRGVGRAGAIGVGASAAVLLIGGAPGPTGLVAVVVAAGACGALAVLVVRAGAGWRGSVEEPRA